MTAPISNGPTTHGYTTMRDATSVVACCSHVNPLLRAVTRYVAHKPAILSVGGAAQVRISGPTRGLVGECARQTAQVATCGASVASRRRSASGVPAKTRREQHAGRLPTAMADDDQKQVQAPPRAMHTDCG